jgi:hypothetical protein
MTAPRPALAFLCLAVAAAGLPGCGKVGYLEQPAPLYGAKAKADFKARAAARAAAGKNHDAGALEALPDAVPGTSPAEMTPPEPGAAAPSPPAPASPTPPQ